MYRWLAPRARSARRGGGLGTPAARPLPRLGRFVAAPSRARLLGLAALLATAPVGCREVSERELGAELYRRHCTSCHGEIGPDGALAGRRPEAPDLTGLGARFGSPLRRDELAAFIDGRRELPSHGTREMPAWGVRLYESYPQTPGTETVREGSVAMLVDYLDSVQRR